MIRALPISAKLLLPLLAFGGIGLAVLPADLHAVQEVKSVAAAAPKPSPSFNVAPMPVQVINKAPVISPPLPAVETTPAATAASAASAPTGTWASASTTVIASASPAEPADLSSDRVKAAVNVRAEGRKGSPVLFVLPAGAQVRIAESEGGWVHVYSDQGEGWIFSSFVGAPQSTTVSAPKQPTSGKVLRVAGTVTVRDAPGGDPLFRLEAGEPIRMLETEGNWGHIVTSTGEDGWVRVQ